MTHTATPSMPPTAPTSAAWMAMMTAEQKQYSLARLALVQTWVDRFTVALKRTTAPKVRISRTFSYYAPIHNEICIPARTLCLLEDRHLWLVVAHECGHFRRRWKLFLSVFSSVARDGEELLADRIAMQLTGATMDDVVACYTAVAAIEGGFEGHELQEQLALRRELMAACYDV